MRWSLGRRTIWHGYKVRELLLRITREGQSLNCSFFVDPAGDSLTGMEAPLAPGGKMGYAIYMNQKENVSVPASLGIAL